MIEDAERSRSNELNSAQCELLQGRYPGLRVFLTPCSPDPWIAVRSPNRGNGVYGASPQKALTKWCKEWSPDWTPPVVHDAEWALEYAKEKNIRLEYLPYGHEGAFWKASQYETHKTTGTTIVGALRCWKLKYGPDKPVKTREETAVQLLTEVHGYLLHQIVPTRLKNKIQDFVKEADSE